MEEEPCGLKRLDDTGLKSGVSTEELFGLSGASRNLYVRVTKENRDLGVLLNCTMTETAGKCDLRVSYVIGWMG